MPTVNRIHDFTATVAQDLRYAMRTLNRSRGFALTVVLLIALGVGANTATFSVTDHVLLRALPFRDPNELVRLCEGPPQGGGWGCMNQMSPAIYRDVTNGTTSFRSLGAFNRTDVNLVGTGEPLRIPATRVSREVFTVLGVPPGKGRVFDASGAPERDAATVVIGHGLWQSYFGGDVRVVGTTVRLDGTAYEIIGVMPAEFYFPTRDVQIWLPLVLREDDFSDRGNTYLEGVARLKPGATFEGARGELRAVAARVTQETRTPTGFSFFRQQDEMSPRYRQMLIALCVASLALLLLTSANLASLLLTRAAGREAELAIRVALGAARERLVRQMLTESSLLALLGGVVGAGVAVLAMPLLSSLIPATLPLAGEPRLDARILLIGAVFTAITGIGFGLLPALRAGGHSGFDALREGTRGSGRRQRLRTLLVAIEIGVSAVLLISAGHLIRAMLRVQAVDPGFETGRVLTLRTALPSPRYDDSVRRAEFYRRVLQGVRALPGVERAAYTSGVPMIMGGGIAAISLPGDEEPRGRVNGASMRLITPQFFASLGLPIIRGRDVEDADDRNRPLAAVVSESFVARWFPGEDALGRTFRIRSEVRTVIGVVPDIKVRGLERTNEPQVYLPVGQAPPGAMATIYGPKDLLIRASGAPIALVPAVRDIIRQVDPEQPISDVQLLSDVITGQTETRGAQVRILSVLAAIAMLLTAVGIHGLLAFMVAQRTREIGVRLALGARPARVARMIVGEAVRLTILGGVPGVLLAYGAARAMRALLFGVGPGDPLIIAAGIALVLLATFAGSLIPARKAVRVNPLTAMRAD